MFYHLLACYSIWYFLFRPETEETGTWEEIKFNLAVFGVIYILFFT